MRDEDEDLGSHSSGSAVSAAATCSSNGSWRPFGLLWLDVSLAMSALNAWSCSPKKGTGEYATSGDGLCSDGGREAVRAVAIFGCEVVAIFGREVAAIFGCDVVAIFGREVVAIFGREV